MTQNIPLARIVCEAYNYKNQGASHVNASIGILFILLSNPTFMLDSGFTAFKQIEPKWYRVSILRLLEDNVDKVLEIQRIPNVFQSEIVAQTFETI